MKKIKKIAVCALFATVVSTSSLAFAEAAHPSIDGRVAVANSGEMPRGLFAKTVGYLPGDTVSVTNPYTGTKIEVLVLGSIDPSEGVAVLLSPEAADRLAIKKDSNIQVKITKREGDLDSNENVFGSAVISKSDDAPITKTEESNDSPVIDEKKEEETPLVSSVSEDSLKEELVEEAEEVAVSSALDSEAEKDSETPEESTSPDSLSTSSAVAEAVTDELPPYEAAPAIATKEAQSAKKTSDELDAVEKMSGRSQSEDAAPIFEVVDEGAPELAINRVAKAEAVDGSAPKLEKSEEEKPISEAVDGKAPILEESEEKIASSEAVDGSAPLISDSSKTELEGEAVTDELPALITREGDKAVLNKLPEDLMAGAESGAIVLVPAPENPPSENDKVLAEATKKAEDERKALAQAYRDRMALKESEENSLSENSVDNSTTSAETKIADAKSGEIKNSESTGFDNYIVPDVDKLKSGYYVQIASLSDKTNIVGIVNTYSSKYPIEIVPSTVKKNSYQIMIGPLGVDEYGTILERFKSRGYRDSFIRKVK